MDPTKQAMESIGNFEEQDYYELLEVDYDASPADIKRAYQFALKTFSPQALASYSIFGQRERERILARVDEAYKTLIDLQRRKGYDEGLLREGKWPRKVSNPFKASIWAEAKEIKRPVMAIDRPPISEEKRRLLEEFLQAVERETGYNGAALRKVRELREISLDEIAQRTKISKNYLNHIEEDRYEFLPPEVYVKGFVTQIAKILSLDPQKVVTGYMEALRNRKRR